MAPASGDQWRVAANNTDPSTSGLSFWADVCASWCVRRFEDESEFMELDFTVAYGPANTGRCACYAYQDTDGTSTHAHKNSHAAPDDIRAMEFLHEWHRIPSNQPNNTHMFAMKKSVGHGLWVPRLQSTVYYHRMWQDEIDAPIGTLENAPELAGKVHLFYSTLTRDACIELCASEAVNNQRAIRSVRSIRSLAIATALTNRCSNGSLIPLTIRTTALGDGHGQQGRMVRGQVRIRPSDEVRGRAWTLFAYPVGLTRPHASPPLGLVVQHGRTMVWSKTLELPEAEVVLGSPAGTGARRMVPPSPPFPPPALVCSPTPGVTYVSVAGSCWSLGAPCMQGQSSAL